MKQFVKDDHAKDGSQPPDVDFDYVIDWSRKAFVRSRYIFDNGLYPSSGWIADAIGDCARRVILDAHPDWEGLRMASPEVVLKTQPASPIP